MAAGREEKFELRSKPETRTAPKLQAGHNSCLIWIKMWRRKNQLVVKLQDVVKMEISKLQKRLYVKGLHLKCVPNGHCVNMD